MDVGDADDIIVALNSLYTPGSSLVTLQFDEPLEEGIYQLTVGDSLHDVAGNALDGDGNGVSGVEYVRVFEVTDSAVLGDIDGDLNVDATDIDLLFAAVSAGAQGSPFDVNGDGLVDNDDVTFLVENIIGTIFGDANLDFAVDLSDLHIWNDNKFTAGKGWADGDFNGDTLVDELDFGIWNSNKFTSVPPPISPPPTVTSKSTVQTTSAALYFELPGPDDDSVLSARIIDSVLQELGEDDDQNG